MIREMDNKVPEKVGGVNCSCYLCQGLGPNRKRNVEYASMKPKEAHLERATIEQLKDELRKREIKRVDIQCSHCGSMFKYEMTDEQYRSIYLHMTGGMVQHCSECHQRLATVIPGTRVL